MRGEADAAAHHDAVDRRDIGLGIALDAPVQPIFLAPEGELGVMVAGPAVLVEAPDVPARAEGAPPGPTDHHAGDGVVALPGVERFRDALAPSAGSAH